MAWMAGKPKDEATLVKFEQEIFSVVLIDDLGHMTIVGSSFIISNMGKQALCLSATHIFEEIFSIINNSNYSYFSHIPHVDDVKLFDVSPLIEKNMIKIIVIIGGKPCLCNIVSLSVLSPLDTALILIENPALENVTGVLGLNSDPLPIGTELILVSYSKQEVIQKNNTDYYISREIAIKVGKILSIENTGSPLVKAPIYVTNIPCDPGMSGGPVFIYDPKMKNEKIVCGIISSDMSVPESFGNFNIDGHSYISLIWPCGALNLRDEKNKIVTILDLARDKRIIDFGTTFGSLELEVLSGGEWQLKSIEN